MDYIWEVFLKSKEDLHLKQADIVSPYYEMPPEQPKGGAAENGMIEYNAMYRYEEVFTPLLMEGCGSENFEACLFDILSHYLIQVDLKSGLSFDEYKRRSIMEAMDGGSYGEEVKHAYRRLEEHKKYKLAHYILTAEKTEAAMTLFARALIDLLETGVIYQDKELADSYILYVGRQENEKDSSLIWLISRVLLPFGKKLRILWEHHFGICQEELTMRFERIEIL